MTPRKANTPTLTRDQIVAAAVTLVDRDGLESLSMRKLAAELDVGTMSLYYHVPDKSALYDLLLDSALSGVDFSDDDRTSPVEERIRRAAYALRTAILEHPRLAIIAMSRSMRTPTQMRPVEAMLQIFADAGLSEVDAMQAVNVIGQYAVGVTGMYANHLADIEYHDDSHEDDFSQLTSEEFPHVSKALSHVEHFGGWEGDFAAGLDALIAGLVTAKLPR